MTDAPTDEDPSVADVLDSVQERLGVRFDDVSLLRQALTHRSYAFESGGLDDNERLEFLGDAVLGVVVTLEIFNRLPDVPEGRLAKVRAAAVNTISLARLARRAGIGDAVLLGVGEEQSGGRDKDSILANTVEAIIGAVYLDKGLAKVTDVVLGLITPMLDDIVLRRESLDYKTSLQELTAAELSLLPSYTLTDTGPDHAKEFTAAVHIDGEVMGRGVGRSKKEAEQAAAAEAFKALSRKLQPTDNHTPETKDVQ